MKRFFGLVLTVVMVISCVMCVCAEEEPVAYYSIGEIEGEIAPGEIITVPVYLTLENEQVNNVVCRLKYDDERLEYQAFNKDTDKGEHKLSGYSTGVTTADSSLIGIVVYELNVKKSDSFDNTRLVNINFKVKDKVTSAEMTFEIGYSMISYVGENMELPKTESFESDERVVYIEGNSDGSDIEEEEPDTDIEDKPDDGEVIGDPDEPGDADDDPVDDPADDPADDPDDEPVDESDKKDDKPVNGGNSDVPATGEKEEETKTEPQAPEFTDLAGYEWAKDFIIPLAAKGIIRGTSETTFSPANNITRADFMVLLMRLLEISGTETNGFNDVPVDSYFASAVTSAKELGIAKGGSDGNFNPYNSITREDLCVLVYRALTTMGYLPVVPDDGTFTEKFSDVTAISDYAYDAMHELYLNEIIGGSDGSINPKGFATRAETAVIMYRISKLIPEL